VIRDPIIVLGAPRSGTSMLFETLARSSQLWSLTDESHEVLEGPYHPRLRGWESNVLAATDLDPTTADRLRLEFEVHAQPGTLRRAKQDRRDSGRRRRLNYALVRFMAAVRRRRAGPVRLLEKTPKNCLRIPFLRALFPDARFVFLRRDGRATISSLIEGWQAGERYESYRLPEPLHIAGHEGQGWCFLLPPGWRNLAHASLEEVCAAQWLTSSEAVLAALDALRAERRVYELAYEDLVARPRESLVPLLEFLGIPFEPAILAGREQLRLVNVVSPPETEKWRRRNGAAIDRILPRIAAAQRALGY